MGGNNSKAMLLLMMKKNLKKKKTLKTFVVSISLLLIIAFQVMILDQNVVPISILVSDYWHSLVGGLA